MSTQSEGLSLDIGILDVREHYPELRDAWLVPIGCCSKDEQKRLLSYLKTFWNKLPGDYRQVDPLKVGTEDEWLKNSFPYWAGYEPQPFVYLVDDVSDLLGNDSWFALRQTIVKTDLIVAANGVVLTTEEFLAQEKEKSLQSAVGQNKNR
jgi:hypothetical protein